MLQVVLEDINECEEHENLCKNGHCTNTFGSFMCSCNEGFRLDQTGAMCIDINECLEIPDICTIGHCVNEEGKYHCVCPEGYMPMPGGSKFTIYFAYLLFVNNMFYQKYNALITNN